MLENACYSVITPEGCAAILWKSDGSSAQNNAPAAAEALQVTAQDLYGLGVIDEVVPEPRGGAHRNHKEAAELLEPVLVRHLEEIGALSVADMLEARYQRFRALGPVEAV